MSKRLLLIVMNRGPAAPDGAFVVQLVLHPDESPSVVGFYPERDHVTGPAVAAAFRDFASWAEAHDDEIKHWYRRGCQSTEPEFGPQGASDHAFVRTNGVDTSGDPADVCSVCEHLRGDHSPRGCNACRTFGRGNSVCMRFTP